MPTLEEQYQKLVKLTEADSGVLAFILAGGRGKGITTEHSNYDIFIITDDAITEGAKIKYKGFSEKAFDITIMGARELLIYGVWGSETMWARYNFAHVKAVFDRTGEIQKWINTQELIPLTELEEAVKSSLDNYLNYTHHSLKNHRDHRATAAHLAACDGIGHLLTFLFAAEGRIRPYNEYIEWELTTHPLAGVSMPPAEFAQKITAILRDGSQEVQKEMLAMVRKTAEKSKIGASVLGSWKDYYFGE